MKEQKKEIKLKISKKRSKEHASTIGDHSPMALMGEQTTTYRDETTKPQTYGWTASYRDERTPKGREKNPTKIREKKMEKKDERNRENK